MNEILKNILITKRPTNNPAFCLSYTTALLDACDIAYTVDNNSNVTVDLEGTTCFTAHTDTVDNKLGTNKLQYKGKRVMVKGGGILGADCGSGMYVLIRMIMANVPGLYVFFSTEEQGRIGSSLYKMPKHITKCVSFDRKGTDNLITHQMGERGCSGAFASAFIKGFSLPYVEDPTGSFTDSYSFFEFVPECVNLSVGYYDQHTKNESQDIEFIEDLVEACIAMDWEALPVERDPKAVDEYECRGWDDYFFAGDAKKLSPTESQSIDDFVYEYPYVVADLLVEYGLTLDDLIRYRDGTYA